jgi:putative phosphoesterase
MRVAALYDIHGNLPALQAVLAEIEHADVDALVVGGDAVSGPLPLQTVEALMALGADARFVRGNADREVVEAFDAGRTRIEDEQDPARRASAFAAAALSETQRDFIAGFEDTVALELAELGATLFCHGSPRSDSEILTTLTTPQRLREALAGVAQRVVVCGHTHRQFDRAVDDHRVVNAGSVGVPYEGRAGAYWALLGPEVELRRTDYDLERALAAMRAGGFPDLEAMVQESLVAPLDPDEVSEFFERQASIS